MTVSQQSPSARTRRRQSWRTRVAERWETFWFTPQPASTLVLWRTALGLVSIVWLLTLLPDLEAFYGEHGLLPDPVYSTGRVGLLQLWGTNAAIYILFFATLIAAVLVTWGRFVRVAGPVLFVGILSLQFDNPFVLNSGDVLLRIWCAFFALFALLTPSFLAGVPLLGRRDAAGFRAYPLAPTWLVRLVQIQLTIIYPTSVIAKLQGQPWIRGTAALYALNVVTLERFPVPDFVRESLLLGAFMTYGALAIEFSLAYLLWTKRTRRAAIVLGLALHAGFDYALNLGMFFWVMAIGYIAFLTPSEAAKILQWPRKLLTGVEPVITRPAVRKRAKRSAPRRVARSPARRS